MTEEYFNEQDLAELKESAQMWKDILFQNVNIERKIILRTHNFEGKIQSTDGLLMQLFSSEIQNHDKPYQLLEELYLGFEKLRELLKKEVKYELHFVDEKEHLIKKLKVDIKHKKWKAVWKIAEETSDEEIKELKIDIKFLKKVHKELEILLNLIEIEEYVFIKKEKIVAFKHKNKKVEELDHLIHYFQTIHNFIKFYKEVFEHMIKKEEHLLQIVKKKRK